MATLHSILKNHLIHRWAALLLIVTPALSRAQSQTVTEDNGRFGGWLIDTLFQAGSIMEQPAQQGLIGTIIWPLSVVCTVVALFVIAFKAIQHLLVVAQAKNVDSSPISMTWSPIHLCFAIALCLPFPSGYTAGQYLAIWLAQQSNHLGNVTSDRTVRFFNEKGVPNPPALPSALEIVDSLVNSAICMEINNNVHQVMQSHNNNSAARVEPTIMTPEQLSRNRVSSSSSSFHHIGVSFERVGDNIIETGSAAGHCGGIIISTNTGDFELVSPEPSRPGGTGNLALSEPIEEPGFTRLFGAFSPSSDTLAAQAQAYIVANETIQAEIINIARSSELRSIAQNLLYDQQMAMGATTDDTDQVNLNNQAQATKDRTQQAASGAVMLIDRVQSMMYSAYASAISASTQQQANEDGKQFWSQSVEEIGWPVLGLYWFQMSKTNQTVLNTMGLTVTNISDQSRGLNDLARLGNDPVYSERFAHRLTIFQSTLAQRLRSSRLSSNPFNSEDQTQLEGQRVAEQEGVSGLRDMFPMFKDSMLESAGELSSRDGVMGFFDEFSRNQVFPWVVNKLREDHIVTSLVNTGHSLIALAEAAYFGKLMFEGWQKGSTPKSEPESDSSSEKGWLRKGFDSVVSSIPGVGTAYDIGSGISSAFSRMGTMLAHVVTEAVKDALSLMQWLIFPALFMAFYLPSMIMIQWLTGLVTWLLYIVEATVVIPLWGILFVSDLGQQSWAPQSARQGFVHFLSILIYPSLMVIGFMTAYQILDLTSIFLIDFLLVGFMNATGGYTFGIVSLAAGLIIIAIACYQIIMRVFSITLELNDRVISWIGQRMAFNENSVEGQARAGIMGVVGKLEMANRPSMTDSTKPNANKSGGDNPRGKFSTK